MSKAFSFNNFDKFQTVEQMNPTSRMTQYAFNGRIFLPPNTEQFASETGAYGGSDNDVSQFYGRGMIPMAPNETTKPYDLYSGSSQQQDTNVSIISNIIVPNAVARTFFSNDNVERIQNKIIDDVFKASSKQVSKQSYQELQIIMKSIYLQYSRNLDTDIEGQVVKLNKYVIDECVHIIVPNMMQYNNYIKDITSPIAVMPLPQNVSNKGSKQYDLSSTIPSPIYSNSNY